VEWSFTKEDRELFVFVRHLIRLRKKHPAFRRRYFFQGRDIVGAGVKDITWLTPGGNEMTDEEWNQSFARCLGLVLAGDAIKEYDERGRRIKDDNLIVLLNAHHEDLDFALPIEPKHARWQVHIDTSYSERPKSERPFYHSGQTYPLKGRSLALLNEFKTPQPTNTYQALATDENRQK
jgi:glycogen operon protein